MRVSSSSSEHYIPIPWGYIFLQRQEWHPPLFPRSKERGMTLNLELEITLTLNPDQGLDWGLGASLPDQCDGKVFILTKDL